MINCTTPDGGRPYKFRADERFRSVRQHVDDLFDIFSIQEMKNTISDSFRTNQCIIFPIENVRNWKKLSETFTRLVGLRKYFDYKIHVKVMQEQNERHVMVYVHCTHESTMPDIITNLEKSGNSYPSFESFEPIMWKRSTKARCESLL